MTGSHKDLVMHLTVRPYMQHPGSDMTGQTCMRRDPRRYALGLHSKCICDCDNLVGSAADSAAFLPQDLWLCIRQNGCDL